MSSTTLYRLSGISLLIGAIISMIATAPGFFVSSDPTITLNIVRSLVRLFGVVFMILGLPGIYARQARWTGILGLLGFVLLLSYLCLVGIFADILEAFVKPLLAAHALLNAPTPPAADALFMVMGLAGVVGGILYGIATLRAAIFPRWIAIVLMIGVVLEFLSSMFLPDNISGIGLLTFLLGLAGFGASSWSMRQIAVQAPPSPTGVPA